MNITAKRLRELREKYGYSQADVAKILNIARPSYVNYETGKSKPVRKLTELSKLFNVSTDYILGTEQTTEVINPPIIKKDILEIIKSEDFLFNGVPVSKKDRELLKRFVQSIYNYSSTDN